MTLYDLYLRVIGTTGLDTIDLVSLRACISNCMADLTSRGYKLFKELHLSDFGTQTFDYDFIKIDNPTDFQKTTAKEYNQDDADNKMYKENQIVKFTESNEYYKCTITNRRVEGLDVDGNWVCLDLPKDIRKINYLRLYLSENATVAKRVPLTDPRIQCNFKNNRFRSKVDDWEAIYYILNDKIYIEWNGRFGTDLLELSFGYYQKLYAPEMPLDPNDSDKLKNITLDIRPEFEDALVLYAAYFYTARVLKDTDKINLALSNYKYYIEDIIHELSYEDEFNEEDAVIKLEEEE